MPFSEVQPIAVLVSFYGNSPFLKDFLDSLSRQTCQSFRLLYRFDGAPSSAIRDLLAQYDFAEQVGDERFHGIPGTYWELMRLATGYPYLMFADQDDIWHPDKIEKSFAEIRKMEAQYGKSMPLMVHSDLTAINSEGKQLFQSFFSYLSLDYRRNSLQDLMVQNNVTGCTMIFNRALAEYMKHPVPVICHDWYMAMIAAAFGKIGFINECLIDYRQHGKNYFGVCTRIRRLKHCLHRSRLHARLSRTQNQARFFLDEFRSQLTFKQIAFLEAWGKSLPTLSYWERLTMVFQFRFRKNDWLRTLGMWWAL